MQPCETCRGTGKVFHLAEGGRGAICRCCGGTGEHSDMDKFPCLPKK